MVSFMMVEFSFLLICQHLLLFGAVEYIWDGEHGNDCDDLIATVEIDGS